MEDVVWFLYGFRALIYEFVFSFVCQRMNYDQGCKLIGGFLLSFFCFNWTAHCLFAPPELYRLRDGLHTLRAIGDTF